MTDKKITELTALTTPAAGDLMVIVDDPGGSAETKKTTFAEFVNTALFSSYIDILNWHDSSLFTTVIDSGGMISFYYSNLLLSTGIVSGRKAFICDNEMVNIGLNTLQVATIDVCVHFITSNTTQTIYIMFSEDKTAPPDLTMYGFGFKILNGDLYATSGDESDEEATDTGVDITVGQYDLRLRCEFKMQSYVKFYVNDVLKATHSNHFPDDLYFYRNFGIVTGANSGRYFYIGRTLIKIDY